MKPAPFEYVRVDSVEEAVAILSDTGDEAKVLAGGQSLIPMMRLRLSRPSLLVDISRIPEIRGAQRIGNRVRIGALTRHADLERGELGAIARAADRVGCCAAHRPHTYSNKGDRRRLVGPRRSVVRVVLAGVGFGRHHDRDWTRRIAQYPRRRLLPGFHDDDVAER